ncbi:HNH endonuclease [Pectobacterium brasiliense]|uniref:HNH endonuclease n=1 Tax=Enterobacterales TaxID=91347 RepID=UPI0015DFE9BC|nr:MULTISPECIES: HNH endonuclease [Enterobacterales]MBA0219757.1 HNH endonuclease [Pectobacterium brasiliense]MBN3073905.1 HNH endonuclease [Pectobacterium brasiliense]MBN3170493.1 HNH endonuclease [Pectobacterium brasiliense]MCR9000975.1 HNH endonuclease [Rahnella perminowiae]
MRHVPRGTGQPPSSLSALNAEGKSELQRVREYYAGPKQEKSFKFEAYSSDDVKWRLNTLFHFKCAYCETFFSASSPVDVEHYRPKSKVSEDATHPGYWWLAMDWENLLPSCIDCNRKRRQHIVTPSSSLISLLEHSQKPGTSGGKKDSFPLAAAGIRMRPESRDHQAEQALLLNPCEHQPREFLHFVSVGAPSLSLVVPTGEGGSLQGATSIHVYGLNRLGLVQDRTRYLRRLEFLGDMLISLGELIDNVNAMTLEDEQKDAIIRPLRLLLDKTGKEMASMARADQPYSVMAETWIAQFYRQIENQGV